ncbi:MAG: glycosyltransferase family 2 protein [Bacteroidota bacterium]
MQDLPQISIIAPLYNEKDTFPLLVERLNKLMDSSSISIEVVLIDDGSKDNTPELMAALALSDKRYHCLFLSRNHGHQSAVTAGMARAEGTEGAFIIDGDLQDPPELLSEFYLYLKKGFDVVYAVRKKRKEGWLKRTAYSTFYRILKSISYIDIPLDSGDFSLVSRRIINVMNQMPEESRYLRGMRTWVGFKQIGVEYDRDSRAAGESKYSLKLLFKLAYNGIFNFSEAPIKLVSSMGIGTFIIASMYLLTVLFKKFFIQDYVPEGFTALLFVIILFAGVQLIALGIIGEYVLRIFFQVKKRPLFLIKKVIKNGEIID